MQRKAQSEQFSAASLAGESRSFWLCHPMLYSCFSAAWTAPKNSRRPEARGGQGSSPAYSRSRL